MQGNQTGRMIAVCGVVCSECPAHLAQARGAAHQKRTADAWWRIYQLRLAPEKISCGGCLGPDEELIEASRRCKARRCCLGEGLSNCGECSRRTCKDLEKAQRQWDDVPKLAATLSRADFVAYAQPYCGHRRRLAGLRPTRHGAADRRRH